MSGMRAPWASTAWAVGIMASPRVPAEVTASVVPFGRVRRIDHAPARSLERADRRHLGVSQREIEYREVGGKVVGIGGARDRNDSALHQEAQRHLRRVA